MKFTLSLICLVATMANAIPLLPKMHNDVLAPRTDSLDATAASVSAGVSASGTTDGSTDTESGSDTGSGSGSGSDTEGDNGSGILGLDLKGLDVGLDSLGLNLGGDGGNDDESSGLGDIL